MAAQRPITLHDVLTFRLGLGMDFEAPWPQPLLEAMDGLGMGGGAPSRRCRPGPTSGCAGWATLPLLYQPGERWLYNTGSDVLGVLIARASGQPLDVFLRERVFGPLGMVDTGFATRHTDRSAPATRRTRRPASGSCTTRPNGPVGRRHRRSPRAAAGWCPRSTTWRAFASMLLSGGRLPGGGRLLSRATVEAMTTDQLGADRGAGGPSPDGSQGWGFGVGVQVRRTGPTRTVGSYGWDGGLGSSWANDPAEGLVGVVLTTDMFSSAFPLPGGDPRLLDLRLRRRR